MNRTIKEATVKRHHYDSHQQLETHLTDFINTEHLERFDFSWKSQNALTFYFRSTFLNFDDSVKVQVDLGGYLARASDPPPGNMVMWKGLSRLIDIELGTNIGIKLVGN